MNKPTLLKMACILFAFCAATAIASPAQILTTLHSFSGPDGGYPTAGLIQGKEGNFYGTTTSGGAGNDGTVFKITPEGTLTTLNSFYLTAGDFSEAPLVHASDGNFYGTAASGGFHGFGTVFKITPSGTLTGLYSFCSQSKCSDGEDPYGWLVQGSDGNLYGTTPYGGTNNGGTVFEITLSGTLTTLYSFCSHSNCSDGAEVYAGLVQSSDGNFYGTTAYGGANHDCSGVHDPGCGTVFKITPAGTLTTLYSFCSQPACADGQYPYNGVIQARDGNFYGVTTSAGGNCSPNCGTVFKITPAGELTTLYTFCSQSGCPDGNQPAAPLVQASGGNFYGTTELGGANNYGTIFKITPGGTLTTLHSFDGIDGDYPEGGLVQGLPGTFYGTTPSGGANNEGTVFRLSIVRTCSVCPNL